MLKKSDAISGGDSHGSIAGICLDYWDSMLIHFCPSDITGGFIACLC